MALASSKRRGYTDPEYVVINELLNTMDDVDDLQGGATNVHAHANANSMVANGAGPLTTKRLRTHNGNANANTTIHSNNANANNFAGLRRPSVLDDRDALDDFGDDSDDDDASDDDDGSDKSRRAAAGGGSRHTKLTDLEQHVRNLERENLHLKQTLLLGKKGSVMMAGGSGGGARGAHENIQQKLSDRTRVVQEMVDQLNAPVLSLGDAARVWHEDCRLGVGVREWDAFGRLETISLWHMIRSVFATIAVDIVELRPHLPDGEMILTKWRVQGEIASPAQLQRVISSEDCPPTMKVALQAIKSSDLTFTVTTYVIFHDAQIAEQHHCWDQVGVFKRLFGGEIPAAVQEILAIPEEDDEEDDEGEDEEGEGEREDDDREGDEDHNDDLDDETE